MDSSALSPGRSAVSPVVGVILLVAITVILSATIGMFVLNLGDTTPDHSTAGVTISETENGATVQVVSMGSTNELTVLVDGTEEATLSTVGDSVSVPAGEVTVIAANGGEGTVISSETVSTSGTTATGGDAPNLLSSGDHVYSGDWGGELHKYTSDGTVDWTYTEHTDRIYGTAVDEDGYSYTASWDTTTHKVAPDGTTEWVYDGHTDYVWGVAVDSDGYVYTSSYDNTVHKIAPDGTNVWTYDAGTRVFGLTVDGDGNVFAGTGSKLHKIQPDGTAAWTYAGHSSNVYIAAIGADGNIYTGSDSGAIHKLDQDGNKLWENTDHADRVYSVAIGPDGDVYSGSYDFTVQRIDAADGTRQWEYTGHSNDVTAIDVSIDGYVYSGDRDFEVHKLDTDGNHIWTYTGHASDLGVDGISVGP